MTSLTKHKEGEGQGAARPKPRPSASRRPREPRRLKVGEDMVTITPANPRFPMAYTYAIEVNGQMRGYVGFVPKSRWSGWTQRWVAYKLITPLTHQGTARLGELGELHVSGDTLIELAKGFPAAVAQGRAPSREEAEEILRAADRENAERKRQSEARYAQRKRERLVEQQRAAARTEAFPRFLAALREIEAGHNDPRTLAREALGDLLAGDPE